MAHLHTVMRFPTTMTVAIIVLLEATSLGIMTTPAERMIAQSIAQATSCWLQCSAVFLWQPRGRYSKRGEFALVAGEFATTLDRCARQCPGNPSRLAWPAFNSKARGERLQSRVNDSHHAQLRDILSEIEAVVAIPVASWSQLSDANSNAMFLCM